jgi:thiol-disulfide isomerase/thioredoxin
VALSEGQAVRVVAWVGFVTCCLLASGCSLFGKRAPANPAAQARNDRGTAAPADRSAIAPAIPDRSAPPPGLGGLLAGQVIDSFNRHPTAAFIQVAELGSAAPAAAPIDVAADSQGYFTIQGLKPGRHYQLTARAREGGHVLAGTTFATPPNPKLLIHISEDFASPNTPAVPGAPAVPGQGKTPASAAEPADAKDQDKPKGKEQAWVPGRDPGDNPGAAAIVAPRNPVRGAELGPPAGGAIAPANATPAPSTPQARTNPNVTSIPVQAPANTLAPVPPAPAPSVAPAGPTRVPSCDLTGKTLNNFALNDLNGQTYEFRRHRTGKLVLLDFWRTDCIPCQYAIRHLTILRDRYGPYGLEILGIAYETGTTREQVARVDRIRQRLGINYRLLLGGAAQCPVRTQFGVRAFPTLVLIDESNHIIWQSEGLEKRQAEDLEYLIQQRLSVR